MVVYFKEYKYDKNGSIPDTPDIPVPSKTAIAYSYATLSDQISENDVFKSYKVAGVTYMDSMIVEGSKTSAYGTVYVNGSVPFCNTGRDPIDAGDEVWALIGYDEDTIPTTVGRRNREIAELELEGYKYVGRCIMGSDGSNLDDKVIRFGQILLGVQ
jgi:hypothetical protein